MKGWMFDKVFKAYEDSPFKEDIVFTGPKSSQPLIDLYKNASVFVYPSFYEGFGFPIIEAFAFGIPVVTSRTSSCGEIAGDSALTIDPSDHKEMGDAIFNIINDKSLRKELSDKGVNRAKEFTWDKAAERFLRLFASSEPTFCLKRGSASKTRSSDSLHVLTIVNVTRNKNAFDIGVVMVLYLYIALFIKFNSLKCFGVWDMTNGNKNTVNGNFGRFLCLIIKDFYFFDLQIAKHFCYL